MVSMGGREMLSQDPNLHMLNALTEEVIQKLGLDTNKQMLDPFLNGVHEIEGAMRNGLEMNSLTQLVEDSTCSRRCVRGTTTLRRLSEKLSVI